MKKIILFLIIIIILCLCFCQRFYDNDCRLIFVNDSKETIMLYNDTNIDLNFEIKNDIEINLIEKFRSLDTVNQFYTLNHNDSFSFCHPHGIKWENSIKSYKNKELSFFILKVKNTKDRTFDSIIINNQYEIFHYSYDSLRKNNWIISYR